MFLSILKTCSLIRQKKINENMIVSIVTDQCVSFISQYELFKFEIVKSKVSAVINNKWSRSDMKYIRIEVKSTSSYTKSTTQFNLHIPSPLIKIR